MRRPMSQTVSSGVVVAAALAPSLAAPEAATRHTQPSCVRPHRPARWVTDVCAMGFSSRLDKSLTGS